MVHRRLIIYAERLPNGNVVSQTYTPTFPKFVLLTFFAIHSPGTRQFSLRSVTNASLVTINREIPTTCFVADRLGTIVAPWPILIRTSRATHALSTSTAISNFSTLVYLDTARLASPYPFAIKINEALHAGTADVTSAGNRRRRLRIRAKDRGRGPRDGLAVQPQQRIP